MKKLDYNAIKWEDFVYYDETSPTFLRWKVKAGKISAGTPAGSITRYNYLVVGLFGVVYSSHRIIWVLFNGSIPNEIYIDHIDGDRRNNRISNLRLVTKTVNNRNTARYRNNQTGVRGVCITDNGGNGIYYTAHWYTLEGKHEKKHFSIIKLGEEEAFRRACEYRECIIRELNVDGAGYTERHGT